MVGSSGCCRASVGEGGDLDRVVAEDAPAAPDPGAFETAESRSCPSVLAFQRSDSAFGAGRHLTSSTKLSSASICWRALPG